MELEYLYIDNSIVAMLCMAVVCIVFVKCLLNDNKKKIRGAYEN